MKTLASWLAAFAARNIRSKRFAMADACLEPPPHNAFNRPKESNMKRNIGTIDRVLRILVGVVLIALAATGTVGWWGWIGVVPLITGLVRSCPAYSILGVSSCPLKSGDKPRA